MDPRAEFAARLEARRGVKPDAFTDAIAVALRDYMVAMSPGLVNYAEGYPWFWLDQAIAIAGAVRDLFDVAPKEPTT